MEQFGEQWRELPRAGKAFLVIIIWGLMGAGYYFLMYEDQVKSYKRLVHDFNQARKKRDSLQTIQFNIEQWKSRIAQLDGELASLKLKLPTKKYLPKLLQNIDARARRANLEIIKFNPRRNVKRGFYSEVPISITVKGTFFECMNFLTSIGSLSRIVTIGRLRITDPNFKNQKMMIQADFRLVTYRYHGAQKKKKKKGRRR